MISPELKRTILEFSHRVGPWLGHVERGRDDKSLMANVRKVRSAMEKVAHTKNPSVATRNLNVVDSSMGKIAKYFTTQQISSRAAQAKQHANAAQTIIRMIDND